MNSPLLRDLPSVDSVISHEAARILLSTVGRDLGIEAIREALSDVRASILADATDHIPDVETLLKIARRKLDAWLAPTLKPVINATGVIVHTNLGRAPLSDDALAALQAVGGTYSTLEYDLDAGIRGSRFTHAEALLTRITGAEAALVVNNNAAAVLLALAGLAGPAPTSPAGKGAVISRGQLVEIGGGFRMPDVMTRSGARLVEVGTTNRTHLPDYVNAIDAETALIFRAHRSNFDIVGFTTEPSLEELVELAHNHDLLFVDDLGSGALIDTRPFGLKPEPLVQTSIQAGADVVMFSGDKLLGGPQAGILVGRATTIARLKKHPLTRAIRPDKLCLAALTATLLHYVRGEALQQIPVWKMIGMPLGAIEKRAIQWRDELSDLFDGLQILDGQSVVGGGSLPGEMLPTKVLAIPVDSPEAAARHLREQTPPVIVRKEDGWITVDPRTVPDRDNDDLLRILRTLNR